MGRACLTELVTYSASICRLRLFPESGRLKLTVEITYMKCTGIASGDAKSRRCYCGARLACRVRGRDSRTAAAAILRSRQSAPAQLSPDTPRAQVRTP